MLDQPTAANLKRSGEKTREGSEGMEGRIGNNREHEESERTTGQERKRKEKMEDRKLRSGEHLLSLILSLPLSLSSLGNRGYSVVLVDRIKFGFK